MAKKAGISKIFIEATNRQTHYADIRALSESIVIISARYRISLVKYLQDLLGGNADSISVTKDDPYCNFFARRFDEGLAITVKEAHRTVEFSLPLSEAERLVHREAASRKAQLIPSSDPRAQPLF